MLIRLFTFIFALLLLSNCTKVPTTVTTTSQQPPIANKKIVQHKKVAAFNQIFIKGNINVSLHTGYKQPEVILHGYVLDLVHVRTMISGQRLIVLLMEAYPQYGPVTVEIHTNQLNSFTYKGEGVIRGKQLQSSHLALVIDNKKGSTLLDGSMALTRLDITGGGYAEINGIRTTCLPLKLTGNTRLRLKGVINIAKLNLKSGWLSMYWVKSMNLTVRARGKSYIQLAGIANKLDIELWDRAHFNGRYLRAKNMFAKTHDKSIADVSAVKHQHTFATDASDIYFYKIPDTKTNFMACEGSVLDMRDWDRYALRDYDRYNK